MANKDEKRSDGIRIEIREGEPKDQIEQKIKHGAVKMSDAIINRFHEEINKPYHESDEAKKIVTDLFLNGLCMSLSYLIMLAPEGEQENMCRDIHLHMWQNIKKIKEKNGK